MLTPVFYLIYSYRKLTIKQSKTYTVHCMKVCNFACPIQGAPGTPGGILPTLPVIVINKTHKEREKTPRKNIKSKCPAVLLIYTTTKFHQILLSSFRRVTLTK